MRIWALAWGIPGFLVQGYGLVEGWALASFIGSALLCISLMYLSRAKGYAPMWGLWGIVPVMGPILLLLQPHRPGAFLEDCLDDLLAEEDPHVRAFVRQGSPTISGGLPLLLIMIPIGILVLLFSARLPQAVAPAETPPAVEVAETAPPAEPATLPEKEVTPQEAETVQPAEPQEQPQVEKPPEPPAPPPTPAPEQTSAQKYDLLHPGMTFEQVCEVVGRDFKLISGAASSDGIVKWQNPDRSYFAARFKTNALERITALSFPPPLPDIAKITEELAEPNEGSRPEETRPRAVREDEASEPRAIADSETDLAEAAASNSEADTEQYAEEEQSAPPKKAVVRVGGNEKQERRQRKAQLPRFTQGIGRGPHDVYFHNETDATIKAGLRTQTKRGLDITIPPGGAKAAYLSNGSYQIYYIDDSEPYDLKEAGELVVASPPNTLHVPLR